MDNAVIVQFPSQPQSPPADEAGGRGTGTSQNQRPAGQVVACRRCHKHKLRCTREKPTCKRCRDVSSVCEYPPPPNRKLLAAQRTRNAKLRALQREAESATGASSQEETSKAVGSDLSSSVSDEVTSGTNNPRFASSLFGHPTTFDSASDLRRSASNSLSDLPLFKTTLPSPIVARYLFEVYFSHLYNARLLFHKQSLIADYFAGRVPEFLALTIFAAASIFLRVPVKHLSLDGYTAEPEVATLAIVDCSRYSREWGTVAGRQVLMHADEPCLDTIQACQNLTLYWFSLDLKDRTNIYTHLGYRTGRLLGFHIPPTLGTDMDKVYGEIKRRCFWSAWITNCISQENASFKGESWDEVVSLPFPSSEDSFAKGAPESTEAFDDTGKIVSLDGSLRAPRTSIMGEFVKLYGLWWEIQRFVKRYAAGQSNPQTSCISVLFALDRQLELLSENFHPDFRYRNPTSFKSTKIGQYNLYLLHCLHQLCSCVLHSSIVPIFSNVVHDEQISKKIIRMCAEEAVKHSMNILTMTTAFLNTQPDKSRIPSIVGYAMYAASSVQFKSLVAQGKLRSYGTGRFTAAVAVMEQLKEYWHPLRRLWAQLETSFRSAGINLNTLSSTRGRDQPELAEQSTDFDRIASHTGLPQQTGTSDMYTYIISQQPTGTSPTGQSSTRSESGQTTATLQRALNTNSNRQGASPEDTAKSSDSVTAAHSSVDSRQSPGDEFARSGRLEQQSSFDGPPPPRPYMEPAQNQLHSDIASQRFPRSEETMRQQELGMMTGLKQMNQPIPPGGYPMQTDDPNRVPRMLPPTPITAQGQGDMMEVYHGTNRPSVISDLMMNDANAWWDQSADGGPAALPFLLAGYQGTDNWGYFFPPG